MKSKKIKFSVLLLFMMTFCFLMLSFFNDVAIPTYASRSSLGTDTSDEWSGSQTTGNLITIGDRKNLVDQGWHINSEVYAKSRYYSDDGVDLKTPEYGWGIQAAGSSDDIGNKDYENGVWYRITLSEDDQARANKGELLVSATALYYRQTASTHYISLKLFYDDKDGKQIGTTTRTKTITESAYPLSITNYTVPKNTASIRYYVSNWGSLAAKPFIGNLTCTLTDKIAPRVKEVAFDKDNSSIIDSVNNIAIEGDTLKYYVQFDEKVTVDSYGTALLSFDPDQSSNKETLKKVIPTTSLVDENGMSKVIYSYALPGIRYDGIISLPSILGLTVTDKAGNSFTYNNSSISTTKIQFYCKLFVSYSSLKNITFTGEDRTYYLKDYTATLAPEIGYDLPSDITIRIARNDLNKSAYTYDSTTGKLTIAGKYVTGTISISAYGVPKKTTVTLDPQGGNGGSSSVETTYDAKMPSVSVPSRTGYTFVQYNSQRDGLGVMYYDNNGNGTINCDIYNPTTLYAIWKANSYTIKYDKNKPTSASSNVTGTTANSDHTYDAPKALSKNNYYLKGWIFVGWSKVKNGTVAYTDGQEVKNLAANDGDTVTLYAVWKANTYKISYVANQPKNASKTVTGSVLDTTHTYDVSSNLRNNAYSLTGWTFVGWSTNPDASEATYKDTASVKNLTDANDDVVTLYAIWKANTYSIVYDSNKPLKASNNVIGNMSNSKVTYDTDSTLPNNTYSITGWTFVGWSINNDGNIDFKDSATIKNHLTSIDGDMVTLYAIWKANTYKISYVANQPKNASKTVSGSVLDTTHTYDVSNNLRNNAYSLTGWTFTGWSTNPDANVAKYKDKASVKNLTDADGEVVTLYAIWKANTYSIAYESNKPLKASNNAVGNMSNSKVTYDTDSTLPNNTYSITGWTFAGWSINNDGNIDFKDNATIKNHLTSTDGDTVTLYAIWKENTYSISFDTNGGSFMDSIQVKYDNNISTINIPTRKGYNFLGFFTVKNGKGTKYYNEDGTSTITYRTTNDINLYAYWTPIHYNIELYSNGSYVGVIKNVEYGKLNLPSNTELKIYKTNFNFVGWNIYGDQNWSMYNANKDYAVGLATIDGDTTTLYAAWMEKNIYTISYDANGGVGAPQMTQAHEDETITLSNITPSRKNYTFIGWSTSSNATLASYYPSDEFTMGNEVVTLYAIWKNNPSLSYSANGGTFTNAPSPIYPCIGEAIKITSFIPKKDGYLFVGWSITSDASSATYKANDSYTMGDSNTILYAVWKKAQYEVTKTVSDGYTITGLNNNYYYNDILSFTVTGALPKVYINGQLVNKDQDGNYTFVVKGKTHVYIANGAKKSLIYSANGGSEAPFDSKSYDNDSEATISSLEPIRSGYTFAGWSTNKEATNAEYTSGSSLSFASEDIILYAVWKANTYTISYDANSGNGTMENDSLLFDTKKSLSTNTFSKVGYTFIGWAITPNGAVVYDDTAIVSELCEENNGNITLYAVWEQTITVIDFITTDGDELNSSISVVYGEALSSSGLVCPTRDGYIFKGYYTKENGLGELIFDSQLNTNVSGKWERNVTSLTLYSYWTPISYTIVFVNGQNQVGKQYAVYDMPFKINSATSLSVVVPSGYHFAGWSTSASSQIVAYTDEEEITASLTNLNGEEVYLYAVFEIDKKYNVIYNANGGSNSPIDNNEYLVGDKITISNIIPTLDGYTFVGWSYDPANNISIAFPYNKASGFTIDSTTMIDGGITLYAVWTIDKPLQSQIDDVNNQINSLKDALNKLNDKDSNLTDSINDLANKIKTAQDTIDALDNAYATDTELANAINNLKDTLEDADNELSNKIVQLRQDLTDAINRLDNKDTSLTASITDLANKIKTAQDAINALDNTYATDTELANAINNLKDTLEDADKSLSDRIDKLQQDLEDEVKKLNDSITNNVSDLNEIITKLDQDYKAADSLINSNITDLNTKLSNQISSLQETCKNADNELQKAINTLEKKLNDEVKKLNDKDTSLTASITDLANKIKTAQDAINALDNTYATDAELANAINNLKFTLENADNELSNKIVQLRQDLEDDVKKLNDSITNNVNDLNEIITKLDQDYKAADSLINSNITDLNTKLSNQISSLQETCKNADNELQKAINTLEKKLNDEVKKLNDSITNNVNDLNDIITKLDKAYKDADTLINSNITSLNTNLSNSISSLQNTCENADAKLQEAIDALEKKLEDEVKKLNDYVDKNVGDLNDIITKIEQDYQAADTLINSSITNLRTDLSNSISNLQNACEDADAKLQEAIDALEKKLNDEVKKLNDSITNNVNDLNDIITKLDKAYKDADTLINSNITSLNTNLSNSISSLQNTCENADAKLQEAIDVLEKKLEDEVKKLNDSITNNVNNLNDIITKLDQDYQAADTLINSSIINLRTDLSNSISNLQNTCENADAKLQEAIDALEKKLKDEVKKLNEAIKNNTDDLNVIINNLDKSYKDANILINNEITSLKNQDNTIIESINALKNAYQKADEALLEGIKQVQKNLDDLQTRLDEKDKDLENKLNSYIIENDKTMFVYLLINITFAVIIIILNTTLVIKAIRKKKSQD